jgi:hypothetical protein
MVAASPGGDDVDIDRSVTLTRGVDARVYCLRAPAARSPLLASSGGEQAGRCRRQAGRSDGLPPGSASCVVLVGAADDDVHIGGRHEVRHGTSRSHEVRHGTSRSMAREESADLRAGGSIAAWAMETSCDSRVVMAISPFVTKPT